MDTTKAVFAFHNSSDDSSDYVLECMRLGRSDLIHNYDTPERKKETFDRIFGNDRACALRACMVLWIEAAKIAESLGLPSAVIDKSLEKCIDASQSAATPWQLAIISEDYVVNLANIIGKMIAPQEASPIFRRFQKYVRAHISEPLEIEEIAHALNISKSHLSHTIKNETGETVRQWVLKEKISLAKIMLSNKSVPMSRIWQDLGFCSQSHFAKCFHAHTGMAPSRFRANLGK